MNTHVDFETAKLLKEKGFGMSDEDYIQLPRFYEQDGNYIEYGVYVGKKYNPHRTHLGADTIDDFEAHLTMMDNSLDNIYLAPTIAEVVMWLYEKHGIFVTVTIPYSEFGKFSAEIWGKESDNIKILLVDGMTVFNTISQAYEEGIIESLKLI